MTARFGTENRSLVVPASWRAWHDEECKTLVGPGDIGALQISAYLNRSDILESELRDIASPHLEAGAEPTPIRAGDFVGFEIAFSEGNNKAELNGQHPDQSPDE